MKIVMFHALYHIQEDIANNFGVPKVTNDTQETGHKVPKDVNTSDHTLEEQYYDNLLKEQNQRFIQAMYIDGDVTGQLKTDNDIQDTGHNPPINRVYPKSWGKHKDEDEQKLKNYVEDKLSLMPLGISKTLPPGILDNDKKIKAKETH